MMPAGMVMILSTLMAMFLVRRRGRVVLPPGDRNAPHWCYTGVPSHVLCPYPLRPAQLFRLIEPVPILARQRPTQPGSNKGKGGRPKRPVRGAGVGDLRRAALRNATAKATAKAQHTKAD